MIVQYITSYQTRDKECVSVCTVNFSILFKKIRYVRMRVSVCTMVPVLMKNVLVDKRTFSLVPHSFSGCVEQDKIDKK